MNNFWYAVKVLNSCKTLDQLVTAQAWYTNVRLHDNEGTSMDRIVLSIHNKKQLDTLYNYRYNFLKEYEK